MIEIFDDGNPVNSQAGRYGLRIDDEEFAPLTKGILFEGTANQGRVSIHNQELSKSVATHHLSDIALSIQTLQLRTDVTYLEREAMYQGVSVIRQEDGKLRITWDIRFYLADWKESFSIRDYVEEFTSILTKKGRRFYRENEFAGSGFSIIFEVGEISSSIEAEFLKHKEEVQELDVLTTSSLATKSDESAVLMSFDFPEEVRVPCEQYLMYFAQFLKDLGVEANTALTHDAGRVLFTVTPKDEQEALDKIRDALEVYLHFPSSPISDTDSEPIAVQRLESNILHLRSELKLAAAELQAKNATIQAQQLTIDIQKGLLSGEIIVDSIRNVTPKPEDKEPLLGGVVALATFKEKGFEVNLGELFRKLKKQFSKE